MTTFRFSWMFALFALPVAAQEVSVPSGLNVELIEVIMEAEPNVARFRFLVPEIGTGEADFAKVADDFQYICDEVARPALALNEFSSGDVVISYSAKPVPFGEAAPDTTQFFQPFSLKDGACIWEDF